MSAGNGDGIIELDVEGYRQVRLTKDGKCIEIDVIDCYNKIVEVERPFFNEKRELDPERRLEYYAVQRQFVEEYFPGEMLSGGQVLAFVRMVAREADKIARFFKDDTPGEPSSTTPSKAEVVFST